MALDGDKIKDLFSSKLDSFEPEVPASVWGGIDQLLSQIPIAPSPDATSQASTSSSQAANVGGAAAKSGAALKTTLIAVGVAASVAAGVFLVFTPDEIQEQPYVAEEARIEVTEDESQESITIDETTKVLAQADFVRPRSVKQAAVVEQADGSVNAEPAAFAIDESEKAEEAKTKEAMPDDEQAEEALAPLPIPKFFKKDISFGVKGSAGAMSRDIDNRGGGVLFSTDDRSGEFTDMLEDENRDYELAHKQPISFGITISKSLSPQFSLETGLMFTYLSSKITSNSSVNIKEEQKFGYLGIPIYLNYNFIELHRTKFYISLGVMMQKDVFGRYTSTLIGVKDIGGVGLPSEVLYGEPGYLKKNISQSNWQFSSHLTIGVAYPIYQRLYINTSIGGAYYFDAGNEYRTIYSDRKFQLDLNLGLRFDF